MWLLTVSVILFIAVIGFIVFANWPTSMSNRKCNCGGGGCPKCPCNRCGQPKQQCRCNAAGGCPFC